MLGLSAVVCIPDDTPKTGFPKPLMLQRVLGAPLLSWLTENLYQSGVERFFLVCHDRYEKEARACLPSEAEIMSSLDSNAADLLHVFLSTADETEENVPIIAGPAVYAPSLARRSGDQRPACVFSAKREALMDALDEQFSFSRYLRDNCSILSDYDGYFTVDSPAEALEFATLLRREQALRLMKDGVDLDDPDGCQIAPGVRLEPGVHIGKGVILKGSTIVRAGAVIGPWCVVEDSEIGPRAVVNASQIYGAKIGAEAMIGPYAHIRPGSELGRAVKIGNFVELKKARVGDNTWVSHLSYLGDAEIGENCNLGCGTATVNFDRVEKFKTTVEKDSFIGCHTALVAPVTVGEGAYIAAGSVITEDVPPNALAIARSRQSNKKDWAAKHKIQSFGSE